MNYPRVLVISASSWSNSNCSGNTYSNIFNGWPSDKVAHLYMRAEPINNNICQSYYRVTEQELVRSLLRRRDSGQELNGVYYNEKHLEICNEEGGERFHDDVRKSKKLYSFFTRHRWTLAFWARELLWRIAPWKNRKLDAFLEKTKPEVLFMVLNEFPYRHRILSYIKRKTGARVCLFAQDDTYTLHKRSWSPLFWLNLFWVRYSSRKIVKEADTLFVICDKQKEEYDKIFKRDCVLLRKGRDFSGKCTPRQTVGNPIELVYTGNIQGGRWQTLVKLAKCIAEVNGDEQKLILTIYSLTPKSPAMLKAFARYPEAVRLMPPASDEEIRQALQRADILMYVDPFDAKAKCQWRLSFSTKIVDYLASSRPILAIGPSDLSSMCYLKDNDAAFCVNDERQMLEVVRQIAESPDMLREYAQKAWDCGALNNRIEDVREILRRGLSGDKKEL